MLTTLPSGTRSTIARLAQEANLALAGITSADPFPATAAYVIDHIERGHGRGMDWFTPERARQSSDPRTLLPNARSIISVGLPFWSGEAVPPEDGRLRGRIARYAWGKDYHRVLKRRMTQFVELLRAEIGLPVEARTLVDTARVFDRAVAWRAGVGWQGKNSMIIVPGHGSWVMLGVLYLDISLPPDLPLNHDCGRCSICLDRCPTGAIIEPYRIDTPRCISYLTIEERGPIPHDLRHFMGNWVFGCDLCQDVCPYTKAARPTDDPAFQPATINNNFPDLAWLVTVSEAEFRAVYQGTAVTRAKRRGMARNAVIALGNSGSSRAEESLTWALRSHEEPLVRGHAAWALGRLLGPSARPQLDQARRQDHDETVREEVRVALDLLGSSTAAADSL
jgi:epoxyqueuosine reductase